MRSLARVHQFWNEWEIQCMVLLSFGLQVFLHFFSSIRKHNTSRVLSLLLWLAYLSADYVATFTLGRLTLHDGPRHQLVLFWTPFLLLHLGSQETIAAFSIEDVALWKRHLLSLVSQVALAIYIEAKSWRPADKQLSVPLVLMFISGTIKYAERTWALYTASISMAPGSDSMADHVLGVQDDVIIDAKSYFSDLLRIFPGKDVQDIEGHEEGRQKEDDDDGYEGLVRAAGKGLRICLDFLTDMTPFLIWSEEDTIIDRAVEKLQGSDPEIQVQMAYKLVEIQLSLIYDYLYTKYGALQFRLGLVSSGIERFITFGSTSAALGFLVMLTLRGGLFSYSREDAVVSYILLAGAIALDISAVFKLISSYWQQLHRRGGLFGCGFRFVRYVHPGSKPLWSEKMAQYNLIDACIREGLGGVICGGLVRRIGVVSDVDRSTRVSPDLKRLVLDKLLEVATTRKVNDYWDWDFSKYRGKWLQWKLEEGKVQGDIAEGILSDGITDDALYFPMTVIVWHIATEMCLFTDKKGESSQCRRPSMELSRYVMYLVAKCNVMSGSNGHFELGKARRQVKRILQARPSIRGEGELLEYALQATGQVTEPCFGRGRAIAQHLLKISDPADRWELISTVWVEMLCYLGPNCGAQFHAKHLSTGGELVTHVRILLVVLGIPFLRSDMRPGKF